jgi:hypothetical protein
MRDRNATPIIDAVRAQRGEGRDPYNVTPKPAPADPWAGAPTTDQRNEAERILSASRVHLILED